MRTHAEPAGIATDIREELGRGITARVNGHDVVVGSPPWVRSRSRWQPAIEGWIAELAERGQTPIAIACDGTMIAVAGLADPIRPDAPFALDELTSLGWTVHVLSGDDDRVVQRVGAALALPRSRCHGAASPSRPSAGTCASLSPTTSSRVRSP